MQLNDKLTDERQLLLQFFFYCSAYNIRGCGTFYDAGE